MDPDQEATSVNDPYEISSRRKSHYAKERSGGAVPLDGGADKRNPMYIIPMPSSTSMTLQQGRQDLPSKELFTISQPVPPTQDEFYSKNLLIASTLVVTYLIEVTVQILLILQSYRSLEVDFIENNATSGITWTASSWSWLLVISSLLSSFLVTLISIMWVFRGMDFSGRLCGRLLCYVMHSFLFGLFWRYLKLAFAYERADLEEFLKLKTIQTYIQSLPLVTIHLAWVLMTQQIPGNIFQNPADSYHALSSWLVVVEMLSAVMSLLVLSLSVPISHNLQRGMPPSLGESDRKLSLHSKRENCGNDSFNDSGTASTHHQDNLAKEISRRMKLSSAIKQMMSHYSQNGEPGRAFLLISRVISLGMLVHEMNYWTGFITLLHLSVSSAWIFLWVMRCARRESRSGVLENCDSGSNNDSGVVKGDEENGLVPVLLIDNLPSRLAQDGGLTNLPKNAKALSKNVKKNAHPGNTKQVIMCVLALTYILFWDLSSSRTSCGLANRLNLWATALPLLLSAVENVSITIFHGYNQQNMVLTMASGACFIVGWLLVAAYHCQRQRTLRRMEEERVGDLHQGEDAKAADCVGTSENDDDTKREKSVNKKETGECLSLCCSSLSHPLNIKRKGHHRREQDNFRNDKIPSSDETSNVIVKYNDYEEQKTLGKLMNCQMNHSNCIKLADDSCRSGRKMGRNSIMFPDLGFGVTSDHTGVSGESSDKEEISEKLKRCEIVMACAKTATTPSLPVTNNYSNIKEALTRRISNKSCASLSKKHNQPRSMSQDRDSVKGDGEGVQVENTISSLRKSSSPSTRVPHQPPTNSNKCMPISIKSPISWLPETCCNDSSGSGGSSNSRNTNTLLPESRFYCPESYIDLENNNGIERKRSRNEPCDFSIVFFDGRGTSRSHKQKQTRTPTSGVLRTARSANATPVASQQFPLDMRRQLVRQPHPHFQHHHDHHHQYSYDDDPIERVSRGTRRNQITGKTYLSDGGSLTSLDGLCEIRASTPVEIKKASRVIVNCPPPHHQLSDSKTVSRCLCTKVESSGGKCPIIEMNSDEAGGTSGNNNIYEKLIDDSYGILICEGENTPRQSGSGTKQIQNRKHCNNTSCIVTTPHVESELSSSSQRGRTAGVHVPSQKLRILCAKCLQNHDPLLTNCVTLTEDHLHHELDHYDPSGISRNKVVVVARQEIINKGLPHLISDSPFPPPPADESDTTDYPSDTEFTTNNIVEDDGQSLSTHFSSATYTWHHNHYQPTQLSQFIWAASSMIPQTGNSSGENCPKEFTSSEYVRTWLMASHPRTFPINNISNTHQHPHPDNNISDHAKSANCRPVANKNNNSHHRHSARNDKGLSSMSHISLKNKSCDKTISKKRRFRQLEKRQRPIGRGASPPAKELCTSNNNTSQLATTTATSSDATRFLKPPPSRKQHPLLFYDMIPRQEQEKPLTGATHKKCRDQLDLFHKELETVV